MSFLKDKVKISPIVILAFLTMSIKLYLMMADIHPGFIIPDQVIKKASLIGAFSHFVLFVVLALIVSFFSIKKAIFFAIVLNILITSFAYLDYLYACYSGFHFTYRQLSLIAEGIEYFSSLKEVYKPIHLALMGDIILLLYLCTTKLNKKYYELKKSLAIFSIIGSFLFFSALTLTMGIKHLEPEERTFSNWAIFDLDRSYIRRKVTYPVAWIVNGVQFFIQSGKTYPILPVPESFLSYNSSLLEQSYKKPSFLIIQVESLLRGVFEWEYNGQAVMPFMRELAAENAYFPFTYVHYGIGSSFNANISVLSGFPSEPNCDSYHYSLANGPYFSHILKSVGYQAYANTNDTPMSYDFPSNCLKFGFDHRFASSEYRWETRVLRGRTQFPGDREFFEKMAKKSAKCDGLLFNYAIGITSHSPYDKELANNPEVKSNTDLIIPDFDTMSCYALIMNYTDNSLKAAMAIVQDKVDSGDLVVVIYGDHGKQLDIPHAFDFPVGLEPEAMRYNMVPMVIVANRPEIKKGINFRLASLTDIPMTLCQLFNIPFEKGDIGGRNIFADDLGPLYTAHFSYIPDKGPREITKEEQNILEYGWGKLGARR